MSGSPMDSSSLSSQALAAKVEEQPSSPFYIHPNENPSLQIVSTLLNETNFHSWQRAMTMALKMKNKIQFVDGSLPMPDRSDLFTVLGTDATL